MTKLAKPHFDFRLRQWLSALLLLLVAMAPSMAFAHASLVASEPADQSVLSVTPKMLTLTFNEPVEPLTIRLIGSDGRASEITQIARSGSALILTIPSEPEKGAYVLSWRMISADGHPVGGAVTFWIGTRGSAAPDVVSSDSNMLRAAIWAARLLVYLGLFVGTGGAFFVAWIEPSALRAPRFVLAVTSVVALAALIISVGLQGIDALGEPVFALTRSIVWDAGMRGSFGLSVGAAGMALVLGLISMQLGQVVAKVASLIAFVGVGLALAVTGHAASAEPRYLTAASVFLHSVSLAFWIGALVPLGFAMTTNAAVAKASLMCFSRWIVPAVAALLVSGIFLGVVQLSSVDALWTTNYGRVLIIKMLFVATLLALALWNRRSLTPKVMTGEELPRRSLQKSILVELILVVVILGVVGLWRFTPPPRALAATNESFFTHLHTEKAMANVTILPGRAGPIQISIQLETTDEQPLNAMAVSVALANREAGIQPMVAEARRGDDGQWRADMAAPVAGRWSLTLGILISDFDKVSIEAPILIR